MIEIRLAIPDDIPDLIELRYERALLRRQRLMPHARELWFAEMGEWLSDAQNVVYVAIMNNQTVGYIVGQVKPAPSGSNSEYKGIIGELVLDLHQYHGGAGRQLVDALHQWFCNRDIERVFVSVSERSPVEQAFWRTLGRAKWIEVLWMK